MAAAGSDFFAAKRRPAMRVRIAACQHSEESDRCIEQAKHSEEVTKPLFVEDGSLRCGLNVACKNQEC